MAFWIVAGLMTLLALATVAVPLLRRPSQSHSLLDYDREIYRARLEEIEADRKIGRLSDEEAEAARAEEGRRLLALSSSGEGSAEPRTRSPLSTFFLAAVILGLPGLTVLTYLSWGAPHMPDMATADRVRENPADQSLVQLLERAEAQLARNPDDLRGWTVVAPVYMRLGRPQDAAIAWRNAMRLEPNNPDTRSALAEALVAVSGGVITEEARKLFVASLEQRPGDARARFYLAIALTQQGADAEAVAAWQSLIADAPADAPWLAAARAQLSISAQRAGITLAPPAPRQNQAETGPTSEEIDAAADMSPEDRTQMIETMVAGLADRLADDPSDKQGWIRLIRSYNVLDRHDDALAAINSARDYFTGDAAFLEELKQIEQSLPAGTN